MIKFPDSTISEGKKLIGKICPKDIYIEKIENDKIYYEIKKDKKLEKIYTSDFSSIIFEILSEYELAMFDMKNGTIKNSAYIVNSVEQKMTDNFFNITYPSLIAF